MNRLLLVVLALLLAALGWQTWRLTEVLEWRYKAIQRSGANDE